MAYGTFTAGTFTAGTVTVGTVTACDLATFAAHVGVHLVQTFGLHHRFIDVPSPV